jgi:hypothetical protein
MLLAPLVPRIKLLRKKKVCWDRKEKKENAK